MPIQTKQKQKEGEPLHMELTDCSALLAEDKTLGPETLAMVKAAMRAGLTDFVTPTLDDDDKRISWKVRPFLTVRGGKPACFLVAYQEMNAHFEILGPQVPLEAEKNEK